MRVGLLTLAAIVILIFTIFAVSGDITFLQHKTLIRTFMPNVDGLHNGAEVRLSGVKIGKVKEIKFNNKIPASDKALDNIEIIMEISGKLNGVNAIERVRTDSLAVLKGAGVLGDNIIDITPGTTAGQAISNNGLIKSYANKSVGDIINASQTAMSNLNTITDDIKDVTANIRNGEGSVGRIIKDETLYNNLNKTVSQGEALIASMKSGDGTIGKLVKDPAIYEQANTLVSQLRETSEQLKSVMTDVKGGKGTVGKLLKDEEIYNRAREILTQFDTATQKLNAMVARVEKGEGTVGKLINDDKIYVDARDTVASLKSMVQNLQKGEGTAGKLLKDDALYKNLNETSSELTKLLYDLRQNPKKYLNVKVTVF